MRIIAIATVFAGLTSLTLTVPEARANHGRGYFPPQISSPYHSGGLGQYQQPGLIGQYPGVPHSTGHYAPLPGGPGGFCPIQLAGLANLLTRQADEFIQAYSSPTARQVPERHRFLSDARNLRSAAEQLRRSVERGNSPSRLLSDVRRVEDRWGRLESRMFRVSRGQVGPNIATALQMGQTVQQIRASF